MKLCFGFLEKIEEWDNKTSKFNQTIKNWLMKLGMAQFHWAIPALLEDLRATMAKNVSRILKISLKIAPPRSWMILSEEHAWIVIWDCFSSRSLTRCCWRLWWGKKVSDLVVYHFSSVVYGRLAVEGWRCKFILSCSWTSFSPNFILHGESYNDDFVLSVKKKVIELIIENSLVFSESSTGVDFINKMI